MTLHCNNCDKNKPDDEFPKNHNTYCKQCMREYAKSYRERNKEVVKERQREWYENAGREWKKQYDASRLAVVSERDRNKYANDVQFKIKKVLRTRLYKTIKGTKTSKQLLTILGIELEQFLRWIEYQFVDSMSWDNYGTYWEIDHVLPCASFDLSDDQQKQKCFHWSNMRPLIKVENMKKSDNVPCPQTLMQHRCKVEQFILFQGYQVKEETL